MTGGALSDGRGGAPYLVEEEGASGGLLDASGAAAQGAAEGAALVAEELGYEKVFVGSGGAMTLTKGILARGLL
jgi:hypothetical protein